MDDQKVTVWHWFRNDGTTGKGRQPVVVGETMEALTSNGETIPEGGIQVCFQALHGSVSPLSALNYAPGTMVQRAELWGELQSNGNPILSALNYAPGTMVQRAELWGELQSNGNPIDKYGARYRKCLAILDAWPILVEFACRCYEDVGHLIDECSELKKLTDAAVVAARGCISGVVDFNATRTAATAAACAAASGDTAVRAAAFAAASAARAAAWNAAWNAAETADSSTSVAASAAAFSAAANTRDAAWAAARAAAGDTAWAKALAHAHFIPKNADWSAVFEKQSTLLTELLEKEMN